MTDGLVQEVEEIRRLLIAPTAESYEQVPQRLTRVASLLSSIANDPSALEKTGEAGKIVLRQLPAEIQRIRILLEGPQRFFSQLNSERAAKFGSYGHTGALNNFEIATSQVTLHL